MSRDDSPANSPANSSQAPEAPWQPQFTLKSMFLIMFVLCCVASGGHYLVKALRGGTSWRLVFILFTLASPMLVMVVLSLVRSLLYPTKRRRA